MAHEAESIDLIGLLTLFQGGLAPVISLALTLGGAAVAYSSGHRVSHWLESNGGDVRAWRGGPSSAIAIDSPIRTPE